jgi:hypothetical protein
MGVSSEGSAIVVQFCLMVLMGVERFCSQFMVVVLVVLLRCHTLRKSPKKVVEGFV